MNSIPGRSDSIRTTNAALKNIFSVALAAFVFARNSLLAAGPAPASPREKVSIDDGWRFTKGDPTNNPASLLYDVGRAQPVRRLAAEADGKDLSFVTVTVTDKQGGMAPRADNRSILKSKDRAKSSRPTTAIRQTLNRFPRMTAKPSTGFAWSSSGGNPGSRGKSVLRQTPMG